MGKTQFWKNPMLNDLEKLQQSPRHAARWQKAQQALLNGRPDAALEIYRDLLKRFPGVAGLWFELGLAAAKQLDFDLADRAFQRTSELAPKDVSMLILLGQQYHQLRRLDKARACFERAAAADASSIPAQLSLADWFERERRLDDAWACVESCVARHPQNPEVLCVKALLLHRQGRNTEAETLLRDLLKTGPQDLNVAYAIRHQLAVVSGCARAISPRPCSSCTKPRPRSARRPMLPGWSRTTTAPISGGANCWPR